MWLNELAVGASSPREKHRRRGRDQHPPAGNGTHARRDARCPRHGPAGRSDRTGAARLSAERPQVGGGPRRSRSHADVSARYGSRPCPRSSRPPKTLTVALIGNPNTGKSTLFTALAGVRQRVGNYPGVTVEKKIGHADIGGRRFALVDLARHL